MSASAAFFQTDFRQFFQDVTDRARFMTQLKRHEGESLAAYLDSRGILTVGVGHNCRTSPVPGVTEPGDCITQQQSDRPFIHDLQTHLNLLRASLPWLDTLLPSRRAVVYNMGFNLGVAGLLRFRNTLALLKKAAAGNSSYTAVANAMLTSSWAGQVGHRARELADQMKSGRWQDAD